MKKRSYFLVFVLLIALISGCSEASTSCDILATTLPVYDFTSYICQGTNLTVSRLVTENVSCLHDYSLDVKQMRLIERADVLIISGAGLEDFLEDALLDCNLIIDASENTHIHEGNAHHVADHDHSVENPDVHHHDIDPHIWLSVPNAMLMAENICRGLCAVYPEYQDLFLANFALLLENLTQLYNFGQTELSQLSTRQLITFHDGFGYFADAFDLSILRAVEEESGSEASAMEIIDLVTVIQDHNLPAIFTERSSSDACASIIRAEACVDIYTLDMAMTGDSYFEAMYHNIRTIKEALG